MRITVRRQSTTQLRYATVYHGYMSSFWTIAGEELVKQLKHLHNWRWTTLIHAFRAKQAIGVAPRIKNEKTKKSSSGAHFRKASRKPQKKTKSGSG